jgi:hypothetical protein
MSVNYYRNKRKKANSGLPKTRAPQLANGREDREWEV